MFDSINSYMTLRFQMWLFAACAAALMISAYWTYVEGRYLISGRQAQGSVVDLQEERVGRNRRMRLKFEFVQQDGTSQKGSDTVELNWQPPVASPLLIQYIPGKPSWSRLAENSFPMATLPFLLSAALVTGFLVKFYREYQEHERRKAAW